MTLMNSAARWGSARLSRRLSRSIPLLGGVLALITVGAAIRRKGWFGGALDTALNAVPLLGAAKLTMETVRGRDLIADLRRNAVRPTAANPVTPQR
jgi:hypothetical protein